MKAARRRRELVAAGLIADGVLAGLRDRGVPRGQWPDRDALVVAAWPTARPWARAAHAWEKEQRKAAAWITREVARVEPSLADFTVGEAALAEAVAAGGCRPRVREAA